MSDERHIPAIFIIPSSTINRPTIYKQIKAAFLICDFYYCSMANVLT